MIPRLLGGLVCGPLRSTITALAAFGVFAGHARADGPPFVPNQALVTLTAQADIGQFASQYGAVVINSIPSRRIFQLALPPQVNEEQFVADLANDPRLRSIDLNFLGEDVDPNGSTQTFFLARSEPDLQTDPTLSLIGLPAPQPGSPAGRGVVIAIIDSGIDASHPFFAGRIAPGGFNFITLTADFADIGPGPQTGHGTLVAGLALRVAPQATVMPLRVLDGFGDTTTFRVVQAIYHAIDHGAHVINLSLGTIADPGLLRNAVAEAQARGVVLVAAAGNDDASSPARNPAGLSALGAVAVASTDGAATRSFFSNYGSWVTLSAPGEGAVGPVPGGGYGSAQGTSFAAPLVAGAAALLRSACPLTTAAAIRQRLTLAAINIDQQNPSFIGDLGAGWLNIGSALADPLPCRTDRDGNGRLTVDDLYMFTATPTDLNGDGLTDARDADALERLLRSGL
jgi:subtilisin family serine protease